MGDTDLFKNNLVFKYINIFLDSEMTNKPVQ